MVPSRNLLLELPTELRAAILQKYFENLQFQFFTRRHGGHRHSAIPMHCRSNQRPENALAILLVSRQIRAEALPLIDNAQYTITAMFPGWHKTHLHKLGVDIVHAARIQSLNMHFLDSNFRLLQDLPNLRRIQIDPPGEERCGRQDGSTIWSVAEIHGDLGFYEMKRELDASMKLMHILNHPSGQHLAFEVTFKVGFKFQISLFERSPTGRPLSKRADFYSVECNASGVFDSKHNHQPTDLKILSVVPVSNP